MYHITLTQRATDGADIARITIDGRTHRAASKSGVTMKLARRLVEAGYSDGPWEAIFPDGSLRIHGPSLHKLARYTVREDDRSRLRLKRYRPFTGRPSQSAPSAEAGHDVEPATAEPTTAW